jgi:hypothetical protein
MATAGPPTSPGCCWPSARGDELPQSLAGRAERLARLQHAKAQLEAEAAARQQRYQQRVEELAAAAQARGQRPQVRRWA